MVLFIFFLSCLNIFRLIYLDFFPFLFSLFMSVPNTVVCFGVFFSYHLNFVYVTFLTNSIRVLFLVCLKRHSFCLGSSVPFRFLSIFFSFLFSFLLLSPKWKLFSWIGMIFFVALCYFGKCNKLLYESTANIKLCVCA